MYITPADDALEQQIKDLLVNNHPQQDRTLFGVTRIDDLLAVRALGYQTEAIMRGLVKGWQQTRQHWYGSRPEQPRIWTT